MNDLELEREKFRIAQDVVKDLTARIDLAITETGRCERLIAVSRSNTPQSPDIAQFQEAHDRLVILRAALMAPTVTLVPEAEAPFDGVAG